MAARMVMVVVVVMQVIMVIGAAAVGESSPEVSIENRYSGCQPRVECAPYEDDVLFGLGEVYRFTWDTNPSKQAITCTVQCTADNAPQQKLIKFRAASRGTSTKYFQWTIKPDGGYVTWLNANQKVIKKLTKAWSF